MPSISIRRPVIFADFKNVSLRPGALQKTGVEVHETSDVPARQAALDFAKALSTRGDLSATVATEALEKVGTALQGIGDLTKVRVGDVWVDSDHARAIVENVRQGQDEVTVSLGAQMTRDGDQWHITAVKPLHDAKEVSEYLGAFGHGTAR